MGNDPLSQSEIDQLFSTPGDSEPAPPPPSATAAPVDVQVYDFNRPSRISKDRKRSLEAIYSMFAKAFEAGFAARMREQVHVEVQDVDVISFAEFLLALPAPCNAFIYELDGLDGHGAVFDLGRELSFFSVDRLLGGSGPVGIPDRTLSTIETRLVQTIADRAAHELKEAWKDHVPMDFTLLGTETVPEMIQIANREDTMLVANLHLRTDDWESVLMASLPFAVLEKFFTTSAPSRLRRSHEPEEERLANHQQLTEALRSAAVEVGVALPGFDLPFRDIAEIEVGTVLRTPIPIDSPAHIYVSGQQRFLGTPGKIGDRLAVGILEPLEIDPSDTAGPTLLSD